MNELTATEVGTLWTLYLQQTATKCLIDHYLRHVEDKDVAGLLQELNDKTTSLIENVKQIFEKHSLPEPIGFGKRDVDVSAPKLFSDSFYLDHIRQISKFSMSFYARTIPAAFDEEVLSMLEQALIFNTKHHTKITRTKLNKGIMIRSPYVALENKVEMVKSKDYLDGTHLIKKERSLNVLEVSNLYTNGVVNQLGSMLCTAFSQVAQSKEIKSYMARGKDIAKKVMEVCSKKLTDSEVNAPKTWDANVTASTVAPFSEKLMMYLVLGLNSFGFVDYAASSATSMRSDLVIMYARLIAEVSQYAKDGADIMIKNNWFEEPPQTVNRSKLSK